VEELKDRLEREKIPFEEGLLFSAPGEAAAPGNVELSLLVRFGGTGLTEGEQSPYPGQGSPPLFINAFPLHGTPGPAGDLPYRFRAALELIKKIQAREEQGPDLPMDMIIAFLGEDDFHRFENYRNRSALEFTDYGDIIQEPENTLFWYLDLGEKPQSLLIRHGTAETIVPLHIVEGLPELCAALNIPCGFAVPFNELYKLKIADGPELLRFTQEQEIRALFFSGPDSESERGPYAGPASPGAIPEASLGELILGYADSLKNPGVNPDSDYHYSIMPLGGKFFFLSQYHTALLLFFTAAVFLLGFLLYLEFRRPPAVRMLIFFRCFWVIPAFFCLLFISFQGAGLLSLLAGGQLQGGGPLVYGWAAWKLITALAFFALLSLPLGEYRIPRRAHFYGSAALLLMVLNIFIAAWADISFIPFFAGALLVIFLGTVIKFPVPVYLCSLAAPFYGVFAVISAIRSGNSALGTLFLSNRPVPVMMTILVFLPFILLFKRGILLTRREKPRPPRLRRLLPFFILFAAACVLGAGLLVLPQSLTYQVNSAPRPSGEESRSPVSAERETVLPGAWVRTQFGVAWGPPLPLVRAREASPGTVKLKASS
jgi:hypothetical protein